MQQIHKVTQPITDILVLCYFGEREACSSMPGQIQQILYDLAKASMDI